jgi:hypothetical protein
VFRYQNIIILSSLIAALTSCSDDLNELYPASSRAISYSVEATAQTTTRATDCETFALTSEDSADTLYAYVTDMPSVITRGTPIENAAKLTEDITISAYYHTPSALSGDQGTTVFQDETLSAPDHNTLASGTKYYWPQSGSMDFYAIYPKVSTNNLAFVDGSDYKSISYETPTDAKDQQDLLRAKVTTDQREGALNLEFNDHICTKLSFRLGEKIGKNALIEDITISGVKYKGTYDIINDKWTVEDGTTSVELKGVTQSAYLGGTEVEGNITSDEQMFMLIPQIFGEGAKLSIKIGYYKIQNENASDDQKVYEFTNHIMWEKDIKDYELVKGKSLYFVITDVDEPTDWDSKDNEVGKYEEYDSYYFFKQYSFTLNSGTTSWKVISNQANWITFTNTDSYNRDLGFWINDERGKFELSGTSDGYGDKISVWAYCDENTSTSSRDATIMLVENGEITKCLFMRQLGIKNASKYYIANWDYPNNSNTEKAQWGFYETWPIMEFKCSSNVADSVTTRIGISKTTDTNSTTTDIKIDFSELRKHVSTSETDGQTSTKNLYCENYQYLLQYALYLREKATSAKYTTQKTTTTNGTSSTTSTSINEETAFNSAVNCAIVRGTQYNKFTSKTIDGVSVPSISSGDILWYIPACNEFTTTGLTTDNVYWTSTGYKSETESLGVQAHIYNVSNKSGATKKNRDEVYAFRGVRTTTK